MERIRAEMALREQGILSKRLNTARWLWSTRWPIVGTAGET